MSEDIHFAFGSADLTPYSQQVLDEDIRHLAASLREYPQTMICIDAYADKAERAPEAISRRRALAVKTYLEKKGIALESLHTANYGYRPREAPYASESELNRRVELHFYRTCTGQHA